MAILGGFLTNVLVRFLEVMDFSFFLKLTTAFGKLKPNVAMSCFDFDVLHQYY